MIDGGQYLIRIPESQYSFWNIFDMQAIIQTQLNATIPAYTWTVALTGNNNKFTIISNAENVPFKF